jgi:hypothetical protein
MKTSIRKILARLLVVCIPVTATLIADPGVPQRNVDAFASTVNTIGRAILHSWQETVIYPRLAVTFLTTSKSFPNRDQFDRFCADNDYWNVDGVIFQIQWVPSVHDDFRAQFEMDAQLEVPGFNIFSFTSSGKTPKPPNSSNLYFPIFYCSPANYPGISVIGLDLNDDIEGPAIRAGMSTGVPTTSDPFEARGLTDATLRSRKMIGLYMPLFIANSSLTRTRTSVFAGTLVTVLAFEPMVYSLLSELELQDIDVFLFWIKSGTDGSASYTLVGHFESGPEASKPNITAANASRLQPSDVKGDIVTDFVPVFDLVVFDKTFRYMVRARRGSVLKDVVLVGGRYDSAPCLYLPAPVLLP